MRKPLALAMPLLTLLLMLLSGCESPGGVWAIDEGRDPQARVYWYSPPNPGPYPLPGYRTPYGYYPFSRVDPSPFYGVRPAYPGGPPRRCFRDGSRRIQC